MRPASFVITPANIDGLAAALRVLGWKLIYGLNLARGAPAEAADEAAYVANAVGALAFRRASALVLAAGRLSRMGGRSKLSAEIGGRLPLPSWQRRRLTTWFCHAHASWGCGCVASRPVVEPLASAPLPFPACSTERHGTTTLFAALAGCGGDSASLMLRPFGS